ncbi:hypothetical protein AOB54_01650 [beta proteobacterium MWH-UniP1]
MLKPNRAFVCGVIVGEYAFIAAVINKDVEFYSLIVGGSDKKIGRMSKYGEQISLPLTRQV